jgi:hypothetical protein
MPLNKPFLTLFVYLFLLNSIKANNIFRFEHQSYTWQIDRKMQHLDSEMENQAVVILKDKRIIEYVYDEQNQLQVVETVHKIVRVNTQNAVSENNKILINTNNILNIIALRARFITASGKVIELNGNNLKEIENMGGGESYKIFAIEGAEIGGEIEYFYTMQKKVSLYGREVLQTNKLTKEIEFELIAPNNLIFEAKSYNGLPQVILNTQKYAKKSVWQLNLSMIPALQVQNFSTYAASLMRIDFKLSHYAENPEYKVFTWANAAQLIAKKVYDFGLQNPKSLQPILDAVAEITKNCKTTASKIIAIEEFIKTNIRLEPNSLHENLHHIFQKKYGNQSDITKLFVFCLQAAHVQHELVLTSNRLQAKFDGEFESWCFLEKYLLWFPETNKFLSPNDKAYRYGFVPYQYTENQGLFIDFSNGFAYTQIKKIPAFLAVENTDKAELHLVFDTQNYAMQCEIKTLLSGYYAAPLQEVYATTEDKAALWQQVFRYILADATVKNVKFNPLPKRHEDANTSLEISATLHSSILLQKAGDKYLFNIGGIMNTQNRLNIDNQAITEIENDFNKTYQRKITFDIPEGFVVRNLEDLNYSAILAESEEVTTWFKSTYQLVGNKVEVAISASYGNIHYTGNAYQNFCKVLKAANSFGKTVLVFQKIK